MARLIPQFGGYLAQAEVTGAPGEPRSGKWKVRVPVARFDAFLEAVVALGELIGRKTDSQDVTEEFYDLEARTKTKKVEEARLLKHLEESTGTLKDTLEVERELGRVRGEIERQEGRRQLLANLADLTTVTISIQERRDYVPPRGAGLPHERRPDVPRLARRADPLRQEPGARGRRRRALAAGAGRRRPGAAVARRRPWMPGRARPPGAAGPPARRSAMLPRVLEPEAMDTPEEARDYDAMDHAAVNARFVADFLAAHGPCRGGELLDVGTGPAQIPIACAGPTRAPGSSASTWPSPCSRGPPQRAAAGLSGRIRCERADAKALPYPDGAFEAVLCNTIVHHIPEPARALAEMARVLAPGGTLLVRDLARPETPADVALLVRRYAGAEPPGCPGAVRGVLARGLTPDEVRRSVRALGLPEDGVAMTSDRHWTWLWRKD
jgi:SAM-dependent methyltransferase